MMKLWQKHRPRCWLGSLLLLAVPALAQEPDELLGRSLDELLNIRINTAAKYEQTASEAPAAVTILTAAEIKAYGYETLEQLLRSVRGFYVSNDRNYSYVGVRGFSRPTDYNNRILLLLGGHTLNENFYGSAMIGTALALDLAALERVEIVRGPGSALYGTNAMFAVINLVPKPGKAVEGGELTTAFGSLGRRRAGLRFGKEFANGLDLFVAGQWAELDGQDLYYPEYDDPATNNGIAEKLDWDKYRSLFAVLAYRNLRFSGLFTGRDKGIPTGAYAIVFNREAKTSDGRRFLELKWNGSFDGNKSFLLRGYYDHYAYTGKYPYATTYRDLSRGTWVGSEAQFLWDTGANNRVTAGVEYQQHLQARYRAWDRHQTFFDGDFPFHLMSWYWQDEWQAAANLALTLGLRWDRYSTVGSAQAPRAALVFHPHKSTTLKLLYGAAFRAPSPWEVNTDDGVSYKSNPAVAPEHITTIELVGEQRLTAAWFGTVSLYQYLMRDLIDPVVDPLDGLAQFRNVSRAQAHGAEFEVSLRPQNGPRGSASYSYQSARDDSRIRKFLTNSPRHLAKLGLVCPVPRPLETALEMQYETSRLTVYRSRTPGYLLANLRLSSRAGAAAPAWLRRVHAAVAINNVFDASYQTPGGVEHRQAGITQNRRNYQAELRVKL